MGNNWERIESGLPRLTSRDSTLAVATGKELEGDREAEEALPLRRGLDLVAVNV